MIRQLQTKLPFRKEDTVAVYLVQLNSPTGVPEYRLDTMIPSHIISIRYDRIEL